MAISSVLDIQTYGMELQNNLHLATTIMARIAESQRMPRMMQIWDWIPMYSDIYEMAYGNSANIVCKVGKYDMNWPTDTNEGTMLLYLGSRCTQYLQILDKISQNIYDIGLWNHMLQIQNLMDPDDSQKFLESWIGG